MSFHRYFPPLDHGYSTEMKKKSLDSYEYPAGPVWKKLFAEGSYRDGSLMFKKLPY